MYIYLLKMIYYKFKILIVWCKFKIGKYI